MNSFGNFVNRILKFASSQYDGIVPDSKDAPGPYSPNDPLDGEFFSTVNGLLKDFIDAMDVVKIRLGLQIVMLISSQGNNYLQSAGLNKALMTSNPTRCTQVISRAINLIYALSALISPFMPSTSDAILSQLNAPVGSLWRGYPSSVLALHFLRVGKQGAKEEAQALDSNERQVCLIAYRARLGPLGIQSERDRTAYYVSEVPECEPGRDIASAQSG